MFYCIIYLIMSITKNKTDFKNILELHVSSVK